MFGVLLLLVATGIVVLCEPAVAACVALGPIAPDLYALVAVLAVTTLGSARPWVWAGALGFVADLSSPGRLSASAAAFLLIGYLTARAAQRGGWRPLLLSWPAAIAMLLCAGVAQNALADLPLRWATLLWRCLAAGTYTAGLALPVILVVGWTQEAFVRSPRLARG